MREYRRILCVGLLLFLAVGACWRDAKVGSGLGNSDPGPLVSISVRQRFRIP